MNKEELVLNLEKSIKRLFEAAEVKPMPGNYASEVSKVIGKRLEKFRPDLKKKLIDDIKNFNKNSNEYYDISLSQKKKGALGEDERQTLTENLVHGLAKISKHVADPQKKSLIEATNEDPKVIENLKLRLEVPKTYMTVNSVSICNTNIHSVAQG